MRNSIRVQNGEWIMKMSEMQTKSRPGWWSEKGLTAAKKKNGDDLEPRRPAALSHDRAEMILTLTGTDTKITRK
jgi:hypothetical protein